jgi:hypothetical protein
LAVVVLAIFCAMNGRDTHLTRNRRIGTRFDQQLSHLE